MKISVNILKNFPAGVLGVLLALIFATSGHGQILLTVDVTNPAAVVFTATGTAPSGPASGYTYYDGIDLVNFFTGEGVNPNNTYDASPTTLTTGDPATSGPVFDTGASTQTGTETYDVDFSLYSSSNSSPMTFTAENSALSGSLTFNLSGLPLPSIGTSHALLAGFDPGTSIGSYIVVEAPEPSTWTLIALGFVAVAVVRSRRARA